MLASASAALAATSAALLADKALYESSLKVRMLQAKGGVLGCVLVWTLVVSSGQAITLPCLLPLLAACCLQCCLRLLLCTERLKQCRLKSTGLSRSLTTSRQHRVQLQPAAVAAAVLPAWSACRPLAAAV